MSLHWLANANFDWNFWKKIRINKENHPPSTSYSHDFSCLTNHKHFQLLLVTSFAPRFPHKRSVRANLRLPQLTHLPSNSTTAPWLELCNTTARKKQQTCRHWATLGCGHRATAPRKPPAPSRGPAWTLPISIPIPQPFLIPETSFMAFRWRKIRVTSHMPAGYQRASDAFWNFVQGERRFNHSLHKSNKFLKGIFNRRTQGSFVHVFVSWQFNSSNKIHQLFVVVKLQTNTRDQ